jgi:hypothetical protein
VDVWDYFARCDQEYRQRSLQPDDGMFAEMEGSSGTRGRIFGHLAFMPENEDVIDAYLQVSEVVECHGNHCEREEYAYYLIIDGVEIFGYEKDMSHDPAVHRHSRDHERHDAEEVSFDYVARLAWEEVSNHIRGVTGDD